MTRTLRLLAAALAVVAIAGAAPARADDHAVTAQGLTFSPAWIYASPGDTISWTVAGSSSHTVTALDGSFDSGNLGPGATFHLTYNGGTILYRCVYHSTLEEGSCNGMCGAIRAGPPPTSVTIEEPFNDQIETSNPVPVAGSAPVGTATVGLELDGAPPSRTSPVSNDGTWFIELSPADGAHNVVAIGFDASGTETSRSNSVRFTVDAHAPVVVLSQPGAVSLQTGPFTVSGTATDGVEVDEVDVVAIEPGTGTRTTVAAACVGCGTASATWTATLDPGPGLWQIHAEAIDEAFNRGASDTVRALVV